MMGMMDVMQAWFRGNMDIVFFVYGMAFFVMGVGIFIQARGETRFKLASILGLLGLFGFSHGISEWMDGLALSRGSTPFLDILRILLISGSYLFFFEFGRQLFRLESHKHPPVLRAIASRLVGCVSPVAFIVIGVLGFLSHDFLQTATVLVRYLFGLPGGILSCLGFLLYYRNERNVLDPLDVRGYFLGAGIAFFVYGLLGGLIGPKGVYFLSPWLNTDSFIEFVHMPVQVFRAVCAIVAGLSTIGILKIFHLEVINNLKEEIARRGEAEIRRLVLNEKLMEANKKLTQLAALDPQTGLYNYRYLSTVIESEFDRAKRAAQPISVIIMDIDYFKSINDVYGHPFGNLVLQQFAAQIKKTVRPYDIVVRYGGEEFVVVSPEMPVVASMYLCQRLLDAVNEANFGDEKHSVKLKVSIAVASYPKDFVTKGQDLIELADRILNRVKEDGGNRFYSSDDMRRRPLVTGHRKQEDLDLNMLKEKIEKLSNRANQSLVEATIAFAKAIKLKDHYSRESLDRSVNYAVKIAEALGLSEEEVDDIRRAAILHDLGKIGISGEILGKASALSEAEMEQVKTHPKIGIDIVGRIASLRGVVPMIFHHHERWDGMGYPNGLRGEQIPLGARVIALTDVYQALTSERPYHKAYSKQTAIRMIRDSVDKQFDPKVADVFLKILNDDPG